MARFNCRFGQVTAADHEYLQVTDTVEPDWYLSGATQELQLLFRVGYAVAEGKDFSHWYPNSEFRATREVMLAQPAESK
jgi:hypothetical protein